ncbi:Subtilase family protein [Amycolatopsis pretoriensis]|uniref:Subtilase family protein n=1 Tax=Amycolatopsis pretoriensis TaxID=218821 RepID=A0A1H5RIC6_9PSEU|nr:S8 family serine peptidase [Amycolatopsis pretoriensis]SEF38079.1 Subtilase family protein [Amycolatopsis pretoriensis]
MGRFGRLLTHATPVSLSAVLLATGVSAAQPSTTDVAAARTEAGIAALQAIKAGLTRTELKQSSRLVIEKRLRTDPALAATLPGYHSGVDVSATGVVAVDISARGTAVAATVRDAGGTVRGVSQVGTIRADLPLSALDRIAGRDDVDAVKAAVEPVTGVVPTDRRPRAGDRLRAAASTVVSEGDRTHGADSARAKYGVSGAGVKVCVLSDGVDSLARSQSSGELPAVDVLADQQGEGDEGTAMLEIIHDLAPDATLGFATVTGDQAGFAGNVRALGTTGRCQVIVDDVSYYDESPFQDTEAAQAVNDVTAAGVLYFSSAGNEGNLHDGTSGYYEGDFRASLGAIPGVTGVPHDFDPGPAVQDFDPFTPSTRPRSPFFADPVTLFWSDPWGQAADDYDLFVTDPDGNVISSGEDRQTGTQDPYEIALVPTGTDFRLAVVKYSGVDRFIAVSTNRGQFTASGALKAFSTSGTIAGHDAAANAFSVAAAPAAAGFAPGEPSGPYPGSFTARSPWERFSSDGPRRVFFRADGTTFTPGTVSSTGGGTRRKPDITAADGVTTSVPGFERFNGTSAAAPHAAAIAALVLSAKPAATPTQVRTALLSSALDLGAPGFGTVSGNGMVMPGRALAALGVRPKY